MKWSWASQRSSSTESVMSFYLLVDRRGLRRRTTPTAPIAARDTALMAAMAAGAT
ncbi:hypothetical protein [Micromonospora sp. NPDC002717]|uniref:hypothetical protein n=1 Tax=Micromonospora sp. NPDC002717 TaxID=3154424 RepID=UPI00333240CD